MARDYTAFWAQTAGRDGSVSFDGATAYDGAGPGYALFDALLNSEALLFYAPKTDWTEIDPQTGKKMTINFEDFNYIEANTKAVAGYLRIIQYAIPSLTYVLNRDKKYIDMLSSINRIEQNLETIRVNFLTPIGYPGSESWEVGDGFDYRDANRLELDLQLLFVAAQQVYRSFVYCGTINAGATRGGIPYAL